jgi:hypothetical protein
VCVCERERERAVFYYALLFLLLCISLGPEVNDLFFIHAAIFFSRKNCQKSHENVPRKTE